jgi:predicted lipoprotein with Yx(FWY)xxD motif
LPDHQLHRREEMRSTRATIAIVGMVVAATIGGVTIAGTAGGSTPKHPAASTAMTLDPAPVVPNPSATTTVHIAQAAVGGTPESILVDAKGLPLYTYKPDTPTTSHVSGQLAALWPPLTASKPTAAAGTTGTLTVVATTNGQQVAYNGHFLYTFIEDSPGRVTGQGVQNFFVATPAMATDGAASTAGSTTPTPVANGYGY